MNNIMSKYNSGEWTNKTCPTCIAASSLLNIYLVKKDNFAIQQLIIIQIFVKNLALFRFSNLF